jgi:hypothetical protein
VLEEQDAIRKVEEAISNNKMAEACQEAGKLIEKIAFARYVETEGSKTRYASTAIDYIMKNHLIPRPLGAKMHLVRELRNVAAHGLEYPIDRPDAVLAESILKQVVAWLHGEKLREDWQKIEREFEDGVRSLSKKGSVLDPRWLAKIYNAMEEAVSLKIYSLGCAVAAKANLFSKLDILSDAGIDARSLDWEALVELRSMDYHGGSKPGDYSRLKRLAANIDELRKVLQRLQPTFGPTAAT